MEHSLSLSRGTGASALASIVFGFVYFLAPSLEPMSPAGIWAIRSLVALPLVAVILLSMKQWTLVTDIWARIRQQPLLIFGIIGSGFTLGSLLWMFAWAPMNGQGLEAALGFFLFPLLLVALGRFLYRDRLRWWHWASAGIAAIGVVLQIIIAGGISWVTVYVTVGYPLYFVIRKAINISHVGGMFWELLVTVPVLLILFGIEIFHHRAFSENTTLLWLAPTYALTASIALWMYIVSAKLLPVSVFGLLSYLQPVVLVIASLLIGERISEIEFISYAFVWTAVVIILSGGAVQIRAANQAGRL